MAVLFKDLLSYRVRAQDGEIGEIEDILFDDQSWKVRYVVVDTVKWLPSKRVIISPEAFHPSVSTHDAALVTNLTKQQIKDSPDENTDLPVSRQYEAILYSYYGWAPYWMTPLTYAGWPYSDAALVGPNHPNPAIPEAWRDLAARQAQSFDGHLRSLKEITGYKIGTADELYFGRVNDAIIDFQSWAIIDLVLNSNSWMPGGKTCVCSPLFVSNISEKEHTLNICQDKDALLSAPQFNFDTYGPEYRKELVEYYNEEIGSGSGVVYDRTSGHPMAR